MIMGILFLIYDRNTLLFTSLLGAGMIAVFLKHNTDTPLKLAREKSASSYSIASVTLNDTFDGQNILSQELQQLNSDVLCVLGPELSTLNIVDSIIQQRYSFNLSFDRIDDYSVRLYSKFPLDLLETKNKNLLPVHKVELLPPNTSESILLLVTSIIDAHNTDELMFRKKQLKELADMVQNSNKQPVMILGNMEGVSWNYDLSLFKKEYEFQDSRRNFVGASMTKYGLFYIKIESSNIFYNDYIECTGFNDVSFNRTHLGLMATYQLISN